MDIKQLTKEQILGSSITHRSEIIDTVPTVTIGEYQFAVKGGMSVLAGRTGSGKTTVLMQMISLALSEPEKPIRFDSLNMIVAPAEDKFVIYLNTEMSDSSTKRKVHDAVLKNIQVDETPANFIVLSIVQFTTEQRRAYIKRLFEVFHDIHLLVLDGGADTVSTVNDEVQSVAAIDELNRLAIQYDTTIINVIHENAGNGQTRGHYGQEAERKSTGTIAVKFVKANKHFSISSKKARDTAHLDEVFFHFNSVGQVEQLGPATAAQRTVEAKTNELLALTIKAFETKKMWKATELKKWVAKELGQSEKTGSRRVEDMYKANYITDDKKGNFTSLIPIEQAPIFQFA